MAQGVLHGYSSGEKRRKIALSATKMHPAPNPPQFFSIKKQKDMALGAKCTARQPSSLHRTPFRPCGASPPPRSLVENTFQTSWSGSGLHVKPVRVVWGWMFHSHPQNCTPPPFPITSWGGVPQGWRG